MDDNGIRHSQEIVLPAGYAPYALARGPDDAVWVTLVTPGALAQLNVDAALAGGDGDSVLACHRLDGESAQPMQVAVGANATVWYTRRDDRVGRRDASGVEKLIELPEGSAPYGICAASDGGVWFTAAGLNRVGRVLPDGTLDWTTLPVPDAGPAMLAVADDGAVWVALNAAGALARLSDGNAEIIKLPQQPAAPVGVAAAGNGVWYADIGGGRVGYVDASGAVEQVTLPDSGCRPHAVAADPEGGCWVTEWAAGRLARITAEGDVTEQPLPGREPHGLLVTERHVWVAMESGSLVAVDRTGPRL